VRGSIAYRRTKRAEFFKGFLFHIVPNVTVR
jgi:hypothetical protein